MSDSFGTLAAALNERSAEDNTPLAAPRGGARLTRQALLNLEDHLLSMSAAVEDLLAVVTDDVELCFAADGSVIVEGPITVDVEEDVQSLCNGFLDVCSELGAEVDMGAN